MNLDNKALTKSLSKDKILACVISKNNKVEFDYYKNRKVIKKQHKINSCTKSILSILLGIAFDKGYLTNIHESIEKYFPKEMKAQEDKRKKDISIYHLLTMTSGLHFPEWGEWNGFAPMIQGGNIVKFVLNRPLEYPPGERMNYNSGCSHLLTSILQQVTNQTALEFAETHLFAPLGIKKTVWYIDNNGVNRGADGLRLAIPDMMKVGQLLSQKGKWNGNTVVSENWLRETTTPHFLTYEHIGDYGYQWWTAKIDAEIEDTSENNRFQFALGFGGQYIIVVPKFELIVVFVSEIYDASLKPLQLFRQHILSSLIEQ